MSVGLHEGSAWSLSEEERKRMFDDPDTQAAQNAQDYMNCGQHDSLGPLPDWAPPRASRFK